MNATLTEWTGRLLWMIAKDTILLCTAWAACAILRKASAAVRHAVWMSALCAVLLIPAMYVSLPSISVSCIPTVASSPAPVSMQPTAPAVPAMATHSVLAQTAGQSQPAVPAPASAATAITARAIFPTAPQIPLYVEAFMGLWLAGFLVVATQYVVGLRRIHYVRRQAVPLEGAPLASARQLQKSLGVRRSSYIVAAAGTGVGVPVTWGTIRPNILLPEHWKTWPEETLHAVLAHELAHIQRLDWLTQFVARIGCAVYWFHPLVWLAARRARQESERACDDLVLTTGVPAADYAQNLVDVVRCIPNVVAKSIAVAMAAPSDVEGRVRAVLEPGCDRTPRTLLRVVSALMILLILTPMVAMLRLTASGQAPSNGVSTLSLNRAGASGFGVGLPAVAESSKHTPGPVIEAAGGSAVLPNGFKISLVGVTQAKQVGDEWNMFGDVWWASNGSPVVPQYTRFNGLQHWKVMMSDGLAPYTFKVLVAPPTSAIIHPTPPVPASYSPYDYSFYDQAVGARGPATWSIKRSDSALPVVGPLVDDSAPKHSSFSVGGAGLCEIYPAGSRSCVVRCGIASGPWRTIAVCPFTLTPASVTPDMNQGRRYLTHVCLSLDDTPSEIYLDSHGQRHVIYLLGSAGHLDNVARRYLAVDAAGRQTPLFECPADCSQGIGLAFGRTSEVNQWNPSVDLSRVKSFYLQTRPYQTVEFRDVQLQPKVPTGGASVSGDAMQSQADANQIRAANQLRAHLETWARSNDADLRAMASASPNDLAALMRVYYSIERLPAPLWGGDPRIGNTGDDPLLQDELPNGLSLQHLQRSVDSTETQIRQNFANHRDFVVAQSYLDGHPNITLWASGRITKSVYTDQAGPSGAAAAQLQQVVGPYFAS